MASLFQFSRIFAKCPNGEGTDEQVVYKETPEELLEDI
jgi:hypothetical protein